MSDYSDVVRELARHRQGPDVSDTVTAMRVQQARCCRTSFETQKQRRDERIEKSAKEIAGMEADLKRISGNRTTTLDSPLRDHKRKFLAVEIDKRYEQLKQSISMAAAADAFARPRVAWAREVEAGTTKLDQADYVIEFEKAETFAGHPITKLEKTT